MQCLKLTSILACLGWLLLQGPAQSAGESISTTTVQRDYQPLVTDLDDDGNCEIVVLNSQGQLLVYNHDGMVRTGWPQQLSFDPQSISMPAAGDIDGDVQQEIVVSGRNMLSRALEIKVYSADGHLLATLALQSAAATSPYLVNCLHEWAGQYSPQHEIALIDAEGVLHILTWAQTGLQDLEVSTAPMLIYTPPANFVPVQPLPYTFATADRGDGITYFAMNGADGRIHRWTTESNAGSVCKLRVLSAVETNHNEAVLGPPALGDLFARGDLALVAGASNGQLYAWNADYRLPQAPLLNGWPQTFPGETFSTPPIITDMEETGFQEIVIGTTTAAFDVSKSTKPILKRYGRIHVCRRSGNALPGWPKDVETATLSGGVISGELDGQAGMEVIANAGQGTLYAWDHAGLLLPGWPKRLQAARLATPGLGDLNGDGHLTLISAMENGAVDKVTMPAQSLDPNAGSQPSRTQPERDQIE
jgi:hypothetical protein